MKEREKLEKMNIKGRKDKSRYIELKATKIK